MPRRDWESIGWLADMSVRVRLGRARGLAALAASPVFEPVLREVVEMAGVGADDNVVVLGSADLRMIPWIAPRCRQLMVVDDLSEDDLARLEREQHARGLTNVRFQWGRSNVIPTPQYTNDRVISVNYVYRSRHPLLVVRQMHTTSRHGSTIVCCEPSSSLDSRTARKYSREAGLSMEDHRGLVAYARTARAHRAFTRDGLRDLLARAGVQEISVREPMHGLVIAAKGVVRL
ncbi:MAG: hypothetical protein HY049_11595 [Acidobacteria bacterium]|nr:hypothetical protein [Acidobacteriota bacterium]